MIPLTHALDIAWCLFPLGTIFQADALQTMGGACINGNEALHRRGVTDVNAR